MEKRMREINTQLVDQVKMYPVLYDPKHPQYHDSKKDLLWDDIALEVHVPTDYARKKWQSFVANYKKYLRYTSVKIANNQPIRLWLWASKMAFVQPCLDLGDDASTSKKPTISIPEASRKRKRPVDPKDDTIFILTDESEDEEDIEFDCTEIGYSKNNETNQSENNYLSENEIKTHKVYNTASFTATEHVMLGFAKSIDGLSDKRRVEIKKKIAEVLREAEMEELQEKSKK